MKTNLKISGTLRSHHIDAEFRMGPRWDEQNLNGELCFSTSEWQLFCTALSLGAGQMNNHLSVEIDDPLTSAKDSKQRPPTAEVCVTNALKFYAAGDVEDTAKDNGSRARKALAMLKLL